MLSDVEQWRIHHLKKERGHKIDLGGRARGGVRVRKEDRPAGSTTTCSQLGSLIISMATTREEVVPLQGLK